MVARNPSSSLTNESSPPTLRLGSRGPVVRWAQALLINHGFNPGVPDAVFGPRTEAAVKAFQHAKGLGVDGIIGSKTWAALGSPPNQPPQPPGRGTAESFVQRALSQNGDRYVFGAEANLNDPNPNAFDCSELVQWAAHQVGVFMPDGTMNQLPHIQKAGLTIPVDKAIATRGALLFRPGHVAISLGDGRTIEARGSRYGVGIFNARGRGWTTAGRIPGMQY